jgi:hypothetical protein
MADMVGVATTLSAGIVVLQLIAREILNYTSVLHSWKEITEILLEATALYEVLIALSNLPLGNVTLHFSQSKTFEIQLQACKDTLLEIEKICKFLAKHRRASWPLFKLHHVDRLRRLKLELDRHKATFSVLLSGLSMWACLLLYKSFL